MLGDFNADGKNGKMLGAGFYCNQHLYQAQKGNYGPVILKAELKGVSDYFYTDVKSYADFFKEPAPANLAELITLQTGKKVASKTDSVAKGNFILGRNSTTNTAYQDITYDLGGKRVTTILAKFAENLGYKGVVYYGKYDDYSVVVFDLNLVTPLEVSYDRGKTWTNAKEEGRRLAQEEVERRKKLKAEGEKSGRGEMNLKGEEWKRSYVRALELQQRYEGKTEAQTINAIKVMLGRITDLKKQKIRKAVFEEVFSDFDLSL